MKINHRNEPLQTLMIEHQKVNRELISSLELVVTQCQTEGGSMKLIKPPIRSRSEWGAKAPDTSSPNYTKYSRPLPEVYYSIVIHHTGIMTPDDGDFDSMVQRIQEEHMALGWGDIGYHYLVAPNAVVYKGREIEYRGCHVGGSNTGRMGIALLGNFEIQVPKPKVLQVTDDLSIWWVNYLYIAPSQVFGHRDLNATACPGRHLYTHIPILRSKIRDMKGR